MKIDAMVTISKDSSERVRISIHDEQAGVTFAVAEMSKEAFADALFGLARVECEATAAHLEKVGKVVKREQRVLHCPLDTYDTSALRAWLDANHPDDGWEHDARLNSQRSVTPDKGGGFTLRYTARRWVDA